MSCSLIDKHSYEYGYFRIHLIENMTYDGLNNAHYSNIHIVMQVTHANVEIVLCEFSFCYSISK